MRRIAVHKIHAGETIIHNCVVEICGKYVVRYYPFSRELPMTEWLGGTIEFREDNPGKFSAYKDNRLICENNQQANVILHRTQ